ncbi:phosphotransferase enzyme family protein [Kribbella sancticallisti]|uniref:Phosphotransferase enzyme family protein n=1 Tax=Kribbella sancticallisti TaxID=460087 RepID=A0ABN2E3U1_9ACTN
MIPTLRSLPDPQALGDHLAEVYDVPFTGCTLLRSLVNDVYELAAPDARYILKLYRANHWEVPDILWETGLSAHLIRSGLRVPEVRVLADGAEVGVLDAAEGERPYTLSGHLAGTKPQPPFDDDLYRSFGELVAAFHDSTDDFWSPRPRRRPVVENSPPTAEENLLRDLAGAVRNHLMQYSGQLSRGICHGDVSLDNIFVTDAGLALYDFDLSGEGYRASDFTGVAATPHWPAFLAGYISRRPISEADLAAIPYLAVAGRISNLRFHLIDKPLIGGTESRAEGWADRELDALRQAADDLL